MDPAPLPGIVLLAYIVALFAVGLWARARIHDTRDVALVQEAQAQAEDGMTRVEVVGWSAGSLSIAA